MTLRTGPGEARPSRSAGRAAAGALVAAALLLPAGPAAVAGEKEPVRPRPSLATSVEIAGMTLEVRDDRLAVASILPGSAAAAAGLLPLDTILVVNDLSLVELDAVSPQMALTIFEKSPGGEARLIVGRGAGTLGIHLRLRGPGASPSSPPAAPGPPAVGSEAPPFATRDLKGGEVSLTALRGRPVLLDFWAAWCAPCRDQAIPLRRIAEHYGDRLAIVGVSLDSDPKQFEAFVYNHHLPGRQVLDGGWSGPISRLYGVASTGIPFSVLIDPSGRIASVGNTLQDQEDAIARLAETRAK